ncbi:hypothetical protein GCM10007987_03220 [Aliivibrio fischeri]|nr:hypothetical protein GCM10007987_03220 [Aliivibrio fischeri]
MLSLALEHAENNTNKSAIFFMGFSFINWEGKVGGIIRKLLIESKWKTHICFLFVFLFILTKVVEGFFVST